jgi:DNA-binding NtrC family response regulator
MRNKIIVVDDDRDYLYVLHRKLKQSGYRNITLEESSEKAAAMIDKGARFDIALIDMTMPGMDGITLLEIIKSRSPETECIMVTALNEARVAVNCLKLGAYDYLLKPVSKDELNLTIKRALERKRLLDIVELDSRYSFEESFKEGPFQRINTCSKNVIKVLKIAELLAVGEVPVLITGESGTGKELLARAVHEASPRGEKVFTAVNMASLAPGIFDAEFFGHTKGAFTGAERERAGYLEHSDGGSLFLDEIGILPLELQGKLLRVLQSGEYLKIGKSDQKKVNVRFIAATNENLEKLIAKKLFRKDLYYRLRGGRIHIPPLRERKEDIPLLINSFLGQFCGEKKKCQIDDRSIALLTAYDYPGNIRELKSIIQTAINFAKEGIITPAMLPEEVRDLRQSRNVLHETDEVIDDDILPLAQVEKNYILEAYRKMDRNKSRTARKLKIGLNTLRRKIQTYGVE